MIYLLESSICFVVFFLFYQGVLRHDTLFERNRYYLLIASILSWVLPLLNLPLSSYAVLAPSQMLDTLTVQVTTFEKQLYATIAFGTYLCWFYWLGVVLCAVRFVFQMSTLLWWIQKSEKKYVRGYILIQTNGKLPTFSFFNYLFWDNSQPLSAQEEDKILSHELAHIWGKHSYDLLYINILQIFFWFNPVIYLYEKALKFHHEYIADASVLRESDRQSYSKLIVQNLFKRIDLTLAHSFNQSQIRQRLKIMQKKRSPIYFNLKLLMIFPFMVVLLFAFSGKIKEQMPTPQHLQNEQNRFATAEKGLDNFYAEVQKVLHYPAEARQDGIEGKVFVQFTVLTNGKLDNLKVLKGFHPACDKAALEAMKGVNVRWLPAKVDGKLVKQELTLPIFFKINYSK